MDDADDKPAQPPPAKPAKPAAETREARLAAALRTNLRRRKTGRTDTPAKTPR
jgi:hypothetical protein